MSLLIFLAVSAATAAPLPTTKIEIAGSRNVTDGWTRTNDVASFKSDVLEAHGRAWSAYDTTLLRFRLDAVKAARFARLKKATLRLHVLTGKNDKKHPTVVAPSNVRWTSKAKHSSPIGSKLQTWPVKAMHPNINYAMIDSLAASRVIKHPGVVDFDVTEAVERWLYQGLPNHGFLVTASQPIFGAPDAGSWTLSFASTESKRKDKRGKPLGPRLILELQGTPPSPLTAGERALALYPSASLAPVRNPYYFVFYSVGDRKQWRRLKTINVTTYSGQGGWLEPRGIMNLAWAEGGPVDWLRGKENYEAYYVGTAKAHPVGFCGHESNLGSRMNWLVDAFKAAEKKHPERFSAYYYRGEAAMAKAAGAGHIDLLIQEGYTSVHKQFPIKGFAIGMKGIKLRTDVARKHGAIEKHIIMLGHICKPDKYHRGYELTPKVVDRMIGELRRYAPEMPGIGFYGLGGHDLGVECDKLAHKHFVKPAPDILVTHPRFEETVTTAHYWIQAKAVPKGGRKIQRYRWFIDNRLVAETRKPRYLWDTRGERPGHHFVTVHAVDSGWNRAASQIPVRVERPDGKRNGA